MVISVELLLKVTLLIVIATFIITWFWIVKSNNSLGSRIAALLVSIAMTATDIGLLTVHCLTGESDKTELFLVFLGLLAIVVSALNISK